MPDRLAWVCIGVALAFLGGCRFVPPAQPDPALLGCYRLTSNLSPSFTDSLGYEVPSKISLSVTEYMQWTVIPTDPDWPPYWTPYETLPSARERQRRDEPRGSPIVDPERFEAASRIPGDSIDVVFPSGRGRLALRLGNRGAELSGRAEWVPQYSYESYTNDEVVVRARRISCSEVPPALVRK
jgi:hypothetical protein